MKGLLLAFCVFLLMGPALAAEINFSLSIDCHTCKVESGGSAELDLSVQNSGAQKLKVVSYEVMLGDQSLAPPIDGIGMVIPAGSTKTILTDFTIHNLAQSEALKIAVTMADKSNPAVQKKKPIYAALIATKKVQSTIPELPEELLLGFAVFVAAAVLFVANKK